MKVQTQTTQNAKRNNKEQKKASYKLRKLRKNRHKLWQSS